MATALNKGITYGAQGGILPGVAGWLSGNDTNPADVANKYLSEIPGQVKPYLDPYMNAGKSELGNYQDIIHKLLSDPASLLKMFGQGYQESPGYKWELGQGENAINSANAAGGMLGTPQHQQQAGELATNLANQDFQKYLSHILGLFGSGLTGSSDIVGKGAGAAGSLADAIAQVLGQKAQYAYAGQAGENASNSQNINNMFGGIGALASFL